ncbi:helix-turn-helix domain-containing protein [Qipengyuania algicida]|uniref:helix-turn-helix domain-containing protein n=1 Tax=Qipengyuania algicida TaxID=1836209 RepID=UPI00136D7AA8
MAFSGAARVDLIREGDPTPSALVLLEGWACRYKDLPDGRRQIVGFVLPGDVSNLGKQLAGAMDHAIQSITQVRYMLVNPEQTDALAASVPGFVEALLAQEQITAAIQREWLLSLGQRRADERMAHLLVELHLRLHAVGLTDRATCDFPLVQSDLAAATGLSAVHVNRTLQQLRRDELIELSGKRLTILDIDRLREIAQFEGRYLQLA